MVNGPSGQEHREHRLALYEDEARACLNFVSVVLKDFGLTEQYMLNVGADAYMPVLNDSDSVYCGFLFELLDKTNGLPVYLMERQLAFINQSLRESNFPASLWRDEVEDNSLIFVFPRSKIMKYVENTSTNLN